MALPLEAQLPVGVTAQVTRRCSGHRLPKKGTTAIFCEKRGLSPFLQNNGGCPLYLYAPERGSHPAMVDPARPRSVAAGDDRRAGRADRRDDPHDPPRPGGAPERGLSAVRRCSSTASATGRSSRRRSGGSTKPAFTLAELSALYFSRTLVECLAATPFQRDVAQRVRQARRRADARHAAVPGSAAARHPGEGRTRPPDDRAARARVARLLEATLQHRRVDDRVLLALERARKGLPRRALSSARIRRAACISSRSCPSTARSARSRSSGFERCRRTKSASRRRSSRKTRSPIRWV